MYIAQSNETVGDIFIGEERQIDVDDLKTWKETGKVPFLVFNGVWEEVMIEADIYMVERSKLSRNDI